MDYLSVSWGYVPHCTSIFSLFIDFIALEKQNKLAIDQGSTGTDQGEQTPEGTYHAVRYVSEAVEEVRCFHGAVSDPNRPRTGALKDGGWTGFYGRSSRQSMDFNWNWPQTQPVWVLFGELDMTFVNSLFRAFLRFGFCLDFDSLEVWSFHFPSQVWLFGSEVMWVIPSFWDMRPVRICLRLEESRPVRMVRHFVGIDTMMYHDMQTFSPRPIRPVWCTHDCHDCHDCHELFDIILYVNKHASAILINLDSICSQ